MEAFKIIYGIDMPENPKTLVIGAGGIGCELLKNLAMTGFKDIEVIDLDTIDISNLNRQFLFTREDVGKSKSEVAAKAISTRFPHVTIKSHVGNIKEAQFRSDFFNQFDIVFNALDNIEARKHVSRVCIALNKPLIDGGSTGFVGTAVSIVKDKTPCYECIEKPTPKQFPVCTIRSTPDKMIHWIVWAKLLLTALFGSSEEVSFLEDIREALADIVKQKDAQLLAKTVFNKVYIDDITSQIELRTKVKDQNKEATEEIKGDAMQLDDEDKKVLENLKDRQLNLFDPALVSKQAGLTEYLDKDGDRKDTEVWSLDFYIQLFNQAIKRIVEEYQEKIGSIEFDKDDEVLLDFVIAASNLRAHNYSIKLESGFKIKEIAGNIIPAVSSTNGLVAGLETVEGLKVLAGKFEDLRAVTFSSVHDKRKITGTNISEDINSSWVVCSNVSLQAKLTVEPTFKLSDLLSKILFKELAISNASIEANNNIIFEQGDDLDEEEKQMYDSKLCKPLQEAGIKDKSTVFIDDFSQDFKCYIEVHFTQKLKSEEKEYELVFLNSGHTKQNEQEEIKVEAAPEAGSSTEVGVNEDIAIVALGDLTQDVAKKRKSDEMQIEQNHSKRAKKSEDAGDVIMLD